MGGRVGRKVVVVKEEEKRRDEEGKEEEEGNGPAADGQRRGAESNRSPAGVLVRDSLAVGRMPSST